MNLRRPLLAGAACLVLTAPLAAAPLPPPGFDPDLSSDEAGLWMQVDKAEASLKVAPNIVRDPALNAYVQGLVCRLAGEYCGTLRVYVVETPEFNAFAMPNGAVFVNTGLLLRMQNEAQLAFVLGHEITHFLHRHTLAHMRMMMTTGSIMAVFGLATAAAGVGYIGSAISTAGIGAIYANSRDEERDADANGFQIAMSNGYAPDEAPAVWRFMVAEDKAGEHRERSAFLADHPQSEERLATLQKAADGARDRRADWVEKADDYRKVVAPFIGRWAEGELARGEPRESVILFQRLSAAEPANAFYQYGLGEAYRRRNLKEDAPLAIAAYRAAIACMDAPAEAWRGIGLVAMKTGDRAQAKDAFTTYRSHAPEAADKAMIDFYLTQL